MNALNSKEIRKSNEPIKTWRIFLATLSANLGAVCVGTCLAWTSPVVPKLKLKDPDSPLDDKINVKDIAWITSILPIGAAMAPFLSGYVAERCGRKPALLSSTIFFISAYLLMLFANKVWFIYLGRFIQGLGCGVIFSIIPMYVGEISIDKVRGATLFVMIISINIGLLYVFCIGPFISYKMLQCCCLLIPILFIIIFSFMPESPLYYMEKHDTLKAQKSLQFLRGQSAEGVAEELSILQHMVEKFRSSSISELLRNRVNRRALLICFGLCILQQASGMNAIMFNNQLIFQESNIQLEPHIASIIVALLLTVFSLCGPIVVYNFPRRLIIMVSSVFMALGLFGLGIYFYNSETHKKEHSSNLTWIPVPAMILYCIFFGTGFGAMPFTLLGEMFAPNVKAIAISMGITINWIIVFFITFTFPILAEFGKFYAFWLFTIDSVLAFFFALFVIIETKDLSVEEIQNKLEKTS